IIGLDGVPCEMIMELAASGAMPNTQRIINDGSVNRVRSTIPDISSIAWSSIITGCDAGCHGIFGFTDIAAGTYQMRYPNFRDLKAPTFWETCGGQSVIINVPSTYPVKPMNGAHISGFVSVEMAKAVYPPTLAGKLQELDYRLDVDSQKAHSDMGLFLDDVEATLKSNVAAYRYLWDCIDWRNFMLVFTTTDRLLHFLWGAWEDRQHNCHNAFVGHFRAIDRVIGEIAGRLRENDELLLLSDHGFQRLEKDVYVNRLLIDEGILAFEAGKDMMPANIAASTRAFALDPGRIYIHLEGKYPRGSVKPKDRRQAIDGVAGLFRSLETDGRKVIREMHRREDIYTGDSAADGPDLVLMANPGFNLKGALAAHGLFAKGIFTGMHAYDNACLISRNKQTALQLGSSPSVIDVGRLINNIAGNTRS
ncbi:MAG TPA: alkaline phosphatase family protein, partial [Sedimentisphaerales bacterium]|nr:alkaline phosphatase family protein [Sedimentisphaerales bacterium]